MKSSPKSLEQQKSEATEVIELASDQIESLARAFELIATMLETKMEAEAEQTPIDEGSSEQESCTDECPTPSAQGELLVH